MYYKKNFTFILETNVEVKKLLDWTNKIGISSVEKYKEMV